MKAVFKDSQGLEAAAKEALHFPPLLMMENAAAALEKAVRDALLDGGLGLKGKTLYGEKSLHGEKSPCKAGPLLQDEPEQSRTAESGAKILIVCGSGNNGGDGYTLARRIHKNLDCTVVALKEPKTEEAIAERDMALAAGAKLLKSLPGAEELKQFLVIVDCILGTGFTGTLRENLAEAIEAMNHAPAYKIACDVPSGFAFRADCTVTMGCLKCDLFTDEAKQACGKIITADLGISRQIFEGYKSPDAFLIEKSDIRLPFRKNKAAHKGLFGHTAVFAGEKAGAGIIAASAALNFGSGLSSIIRTEGSELGQFKISPELMIFDRIPENAASVLIGSGLGLGKAAERAIGDFCDWFCAQKNPACVLDADIFYYEDLRALLQRLNSVQGARIILTPHPKELKALCGRILPDGEEAGHSIAEISRNRLEIGRKICGIFKSLTLVMKSANTFIASGEECFICADGTPSLAKAGSGDVLAGMCAALLAQGYGAKEAAITAAYAHAAAGAAFAGGQDWGLTAEKLIGAIGGF